MYIWRAHILSSFSLLFERKMPKGRCNIFTVGDARSQVIVLELDRRDKRKVHRKVESKSFESVFSFFQFCG